MHALFYYILLMIKGSWKKLNYIQSVWQFLFLQCDFKLTENLHLFSQNYRTNVWESFKIFMAFKLVDLFLKNHYTQLCIIFKTILLTSCHFILKRFQASKLGKIGDIRLKNDKKHIITSFTKWLQCWNKNSHWWFIIDFSKFQFLNFCIDILTKNNLLHRSIVLV